MQRYHTEPYTRDSSKEPIGDRKRNTRDNNAKNDRHREIQRCRDTEVIQRCRGRDIKRRRPSLSLSISYSPICRVYTLTNSEGDSIAKGTFLPWLEIR